MRPWTRASKAVVRASDVEQLGRARRIITCSDHVSQSKRVGLIFLVAREAQTFELYFEQFSNGDLVGEAAHHLPHHDIGQGFAGKLALNRLALMRVICRDVADFMTKSEGELDSSPIRPISCRVIYT